MSIKHISKLGVLALAFCSLQALATDGPRVIVGSGSGQVGSGTPVVVTLDFHTGATVIGIQGDINFDGVNLTVDISNCGGSIGGATITCSNPSTGVVRYVGFDPGLNDLPDGSFGSLSFDISSAPVADYPLVVADELYGDSSEGDIPSTGSTDGLVQVVLGPQPAWDATPSMPAPDEMSGQISTTIESFIVIDNDLGDDGSTLNYTCTETSDPDNKFSATNLAGAIPKGNTAQITFTCDSSVVGGPFTGAYECTHDGDADGASSPVGGPLSCTVTAGPEPAYSGVASGLAMVAAEQGDADPTGSVSISNTGDAGTTLSGSCMLSGDAQISMSNGAFALDPSDSANVVGVACDASAEGMYMATLSCTHNGTNTTSPQDYPVTCDVGPPGPAVYLSAPAPGATIEMTPGGDVPMGATVPDQVLTITNDAAEANDRDLVLSDCGMADGTTISATAPSTPLAPMASTVVTFSCSTTAVGSFSDSFSCNYDEDGDGELDGAAAYDVNCGVRAAASDIAESPLSDTNLNIFVPINGFAQTSVGFAEILDEGVDATVDSCSLTDGANFTVVTVLPLDVPAGGSVQVVIEGQDPGTGVVVFNDTLTCLYTDSDSTPGTASWPVTLTVLPSAIPTLSTWGLMAMILSLLGLGGLIIRRRRLS